MTWYIFNIISCDFEQVAVPLANIAAVNPVVMRENPQEKYIQIVTVDGHDFWFMGFVNFEKATHNLLDTLSNFRAYGNAAGQSSMSGYGNVSQPATAN